MKIQSMKALEAEMRAVARGEIAATADAKLPSVEAAEALRAMNLPLRKLRFFGIRKLNWAVRDWQVDFGEHLRGTGLDRWLTLGSLTIVVGPNGGGKSTVIDLLRALGDPDCWPGLPRENYPGGDFSGFDVEGSDWSFGVRFSKYTTALADGFERNTAILVSNKGPVCSQLELPKYPVDGPWRSEIEHAVRTVIKFPIHYLPSTGQTPAARLDDGQLKGLLNELSGHFPSVFANPQLEPFKLFQGAGQGEGRIGVLFKDDAGQHAFVHRTLLPLGWLQLASILGFMRECKERSLILLDEPDRFLHPNLQRVMIETVAEEQQRLNAQVVLATHSSVLVNPELCERVGAQVIIAARGRCEALTDSRKVLDDLGVTSGDLVQANGIIWVEGPSDRIYIKTWMERRAQARGINAPIERIHYTFVTYGGALLKHLTLRDDDPQRIAMRSVNRNFAVIIDRDVTGADAPISAEKQRLLTEAAALGHETAVWITEGYTIEDYLPHSCQTWLSKDSMGRTVVRGSKVELAGKFRNASLDWTGNCAPESDLQLRIDNLLTLIEQWQTPQEHIEPAFLPPWLKPHNEDSAEAVIRLLTPESRNLLRTIRDRKPQSVAELARLTNRAEPNLLDTLEKLEDFGLLEMHDVDQRRVPTPAKIAACCD
jgi:energy-coupling factor transporter ATP-binding protein EcfA2